jgi:outer membrane lipase/esterase
MPFPRSACAVALAAMLATVGCSSSAPELSSGGAAVPPPPIAEVVSFGDSWTDAGTFGFLYGTADGGSWAQLLAGRYGADQEPNRLVERAEDGSVLEASVGGLNYAEGGAVVAPLTDDPGDTPRAVTAQLAAFLDERGSFEPDQLITVWAGGNDILAELAGAGDEDRATRFATGELTGTELAQAALDVVDAAHREAALVADMLDAGARRVAVLNVIDQGITAQGPGIEAGGNALAGALTTTFNRALAEALPDDARVHMVDVAGLFAAVEADPAAYGYEVVDGDACTNGDAYCGSDAWVTPDAARTYAFAGYGHFTTATRELIAGLVHDEAAKTWGLRPRG